MRFVIFSRVSKAVQKVENQIKECTDYVDKIRQKGDTINYFSEPDTSSRIKIENRKVMQSMLQFLKSGDCLVIYMLDRIARDGLELTTTYNNLLDRGVKIHSICQPQADRSYVHVYAFVAMIERENIQSRTIIALNRKKSIMERVGTTWYGYKLDETKLSPYIDSKSEGKPYLLIPDETEQRGLQSMLKWHSQGLSYQDITDKVNEEGFLSRAGKPFKKASVHRIIQRSLTQKIGA